VLNLAISIITLFSHPFSQPIITLKFAHGLWQYRTGSIVSARTVNIRFLWLLTVRAHGQYNHRNFILLYTNTV